MITAVIIWGVYSICGKRAMNNVSPLTATFYSGVFGLIMLIPFDVTGFQVTNINLPFILSLLYTGIVSTVVCMLLWNIGVQQAGATKAGMFLNFNPVFTAILAFIILHETMTSAEVAGSITVITGCYLFSRFEKQH